VKANVAAAEATMREAQAMAARAEASLALARRERERLGSLSTSGIVSPEALDQSRTAETAAQRDLEAARSRVHTAESELAVARAGLLALGGGNVSRVISLKSPIDGEVMSLPERSGRVVAAGETVMVIGNSRDIELMIEVLSSDAVRISPGDAIRVEEWGGEKPLEGKVRLVEPSGFTKISALGIEEQRVRVIGDVAGAPAQLGDGFRIEARIVVWHSDAVLKVPVNALFRSGASWAVFVVDGGRAKKRSIEVGHRGRLEAEVVKGLNEGERVIVHPGNEIADGVRVGGH
jgi:HlyD family secretion protein